MSVPFDVPTDTPVFVISVAAQLAGMHAQTLRQYDRLGLVSPGRSAGGGRRYSLRDIEQLREVQRLSQEQGVNLAGIKRILELENELEDLRSQAEQLAAELVAARLDADEREAAVRSTLRRDLVPQAQRTNSLVVWRPQRRRAD
jgi:MerR family transcriptional regulator, heat shock protein HspR